MKPSLVLRLCHIRQRALQIASVWWQMARRDVGKPRIQASDRLAKGSIQRKQSHGPARANA